jgi:F0F1-type ATP synthase membrane subunit b/b'
MMNDDFMEQMLRQAKDLQAKIAEAASKTHEQAKPYIDDAIAQTKKMNDEVADRMRDSAGLTNEQTRRALEKMQQALKDAQPHVDSFIESARKAAADVVASFESKPPPKT